MQNLIIACKLFFIRLFIRSNYYRPDNSLTIPNSYDFPLSEKTSLKEIKFFLKNSGRFQLCLKNQKEDDNSESETNFNSILIQQTLYSKVDFLMCKSVPFGITPWEKIDIDKLASFIMSHIEEGYFTKINAFLWAKEAVEGKSFGEY
jgi:hypothetical protein